MAVCVGGLRFGQWRPAAAGERWFKAIVTVGSTAVTVFAFYWLFTCDVLRLWSWSMLGYVTMPFALSIYFGFITRWFGLTDSRTEDNQ